VAEGVKKRRLHMRDSDSDSDDDDDYDSDWDDELETDSTKQESISILGEERRGGIMISDKARKLDLKSNPPDQSSTNKSVTKNNILPRTN